MSGSKSSAQQQGSSGTFVDPSQQPFLEFLRTQGQQLASSQLGGGGFQDLLSGAQGALGSFLGGNQQDNAALNAQIAAGRQGINQNLQENLLPQIGGAAAAAGQRGSSRQGVAEGIALRGASQQGAALEADFRGQARQQQLSALALSPSIGGLAFSPLQNFGQLLGGPNNLAFGSTRGDSNSKSAGF